MKIRLTILAAGFLLQNASAQCPQPTGITHSNILYTSVVINDPGFSSGGNIVEWGTNNFIPGTGSSGGGGTVVYYTSASVTIQFGNYSSIQYYVRHYCSSTGTWSANSAMGSFSPLPCPTVTPINIGMSNQWDFCSRGIIDSYYNGCAPNTYYGNEFIGRFNPGTDIYTIDATYVNSSTTSKKFSFLSESDGWVSPCGPAGLTCNDVVSVAPQASLSRRYAVTALSNLEVWFDAEDFLSCSNVQYTVYQSCAMNVPTSITALPSNVICTGTPVTLTQVGGVLPPGGNYYWYQGECNSGTLLGTGSSFTFTPASTGNYYVRIEAPCGVSFCRAISIDVGHPVQISTSFSTTLCNLNQYALLEANAGGYATFQWLLNGNAVAGATNTNYGAQQAGNWQCSAVNGCGTTVSNTIAVTVSGYPVSTITASGPTYFCNSGTVTLSAATGTGYTYQWKQDGNNISGATNSTYVVNATSGYHNYYCYISNTCGLVVSNSINVLVSTGLPSGGMTANTNNLCPGGSADLYAATGIGYIYQWRLNGNPISGATNYIYTANAVGNYTCVITNGCGTITSATMTIISSVGATTISANGPTTFCSGGSVTLSESNASSGVTYQWKLNGNAITGATSSTYVATVAGNYTCQVFRCGLNATSNTISVTINNVQVAAITSPATVLCNGATITLSANTGTGLTYQWRLNGSTITGATASTYVANTTGNYDCIVTGSCGTATSNLITLTAGALPSAVISMFGSTSFCPGSTDHLMVNTAQGYTYQWQYNNVNLFAATSTTYYPTATGNYTCVVTNACGSSTSNSIAITIFTAPVASINISGPTTFCQGGSVTITSTTPQVTSYQWKKNGVSISGATTLSYTATTSGNYTVTVTNSCGTATSSTVTVSASGSAPNKPGAITGPSSFCSYQSGVVYSISAVPTATQYNWLVPQGATITAGQGTTSITVTFGNKSGNIKVGALNSCGASAYQQKKATRTCREAEMDQLENTALEVIVFPNPGRGPFTLKVTNNDTGKFTFRIFDLTGRCVEFYESGSESAQIEFGNALPSGIYIGEFSTAEERKVMRIVKQD